MTAAEPVEPAEPMPEPTPEPTPETVAPTPEPEPRTEALERVTVTGTVVNLRAGPGTEHAIDGQARAGDRLNVTGRNADGSWLRIENPNATGKTGVDLRAVDRC